MNKKQVALLILTTISYIVVIYSFVYKNIGLIFASFVVSTVLLICFCLAGTKAEDEEIEIIELADAKTELEIIKKEKEELRKELAESRKANEDNERKIRIAEVEVNATKEELKKTLEGAESLKNKMEEEKKKVLESEVENSSLIPATDDLSIHKSFNFVALTKEIVDEFESFAQRAEVTIRVSSSNDDLEIEADRNHIRIMVRNIIDNSIKYMQTKGTLVITISCIDNNIFIVFKDNGEGLSEDETSHVFELNFQGSNRMSGNGLGLAQAKAIVDFYGGSIRAKSGLGSGMAIYVELPKTREEQ